MGYRASRGRLLIRRSPTAPAACDGAGRFRSRSVYPLSRQQWRVRRRSPSAAVPCTVVSYRVGFHRVPYIGPARIQRLLDRFETLDKAWTASPGELGTVLDERSIESLVRTRSRLSLDGEMERIARLGMRIVTLGEAGDPRLVVDIPSTPTVLY